MKTDTAKEKLEVYREVELFIRLAEACGDIHSASFIKHDALQRANELLRWADDE